VIQAAALYTDLDTLAGLRREARQDADSALRPVAQQFEALFVQNMLKAMRQATPEGGLFNSSGMESYQQMHDQQLALEMSQQGGIGLADAMVAQLQAARGLSPASSGELQMPSVRVAAAAPVTASSGHWKPASPEQFVADVLPHAERAAARLGVPARMLVAQAALETGWGQHTLASGEDSSFNVFNIKAGSSWQGPVAKTMALEYQSGEAVFQRAQFRSYTSLGEAFDDYADLISESSRYGEALSAGADGERYVRGLQKAGYATDPHYADKVLTIARQPELQSVTLALNNSGLRSL